METLTATRVKDSWYTHTLYLRDSKNRVKAIYTNTITAPRKNCKSIVIRNKEYLINWENSINLTRKK